MSVTTVTSEATCSEPVSLRAGLPHPRPNVSLSLSVKFGISCKFNQANQAKSSKADAPAIMVKIKLDDCVVDMEVDVGVAVSLMAFKRLWPGRSLQPSSVRLRPTSKRPSRCGLHQCKQWPVV